MAQEPLPIGFSKLAEDLRAEAEKATDPKAKADLLERAQKMQDVHDKAERIWTDAQKTRALTKDLLVRDAAGSGRYTELGPKRRPNESLSSYRFRLAGFCAVVVLAIGVVALVLFMARPVSPPEASLLLGFYFFFAFGLPIVFITLAVTGVGYAIGGLFALAMERRAPPPADQERILEQAKSPSFERAIYGSSQILLGIVITLIGAPFMVFGKGEIELLLAGGFLLLMGLLILFGAVMTLGKPKIVLNYRGFSTPHSPFVPWSEVEGIHLQANSYRGQVISESLQFRISSLPNRIAEFSLFHRFLHLFRSGTGRQQFHVVLKSSSEPPEAVYRLARALWTQATRRDHDWNPEMSDRYNEALRQASGESGQVVLEEVQRKLRALHWVMYGGIAVFAVYVLWRFLPIQ